MFRDEDYEVNNKNYTKSVTWKTDEIRKGEHYTVLDISVNDKTIIDANRRPIISTYIHSFIYYLYDALSTGKGLKIRFIDYNNREITTRQLSKTEIDGLKCMTNIYIEYLHLVKNEFDSFTKEGLEDEELYFSKLL